MPTLLVFSHLRWNFVYQRPQHLLSRMAEFYKVIFVEEPVNEAYDNYMERLNPCEMNLCENVEILRPHVTGQAHGFDDVHTPIIRQLVDEFLKQQEINDFWLWFYTPLALPITNGMQAKGIIYDCMDELSAFKNASPLIIERENALFKLADIVFTGGPSLYQSKRHKHPNVYCFPSSVDAAHYAPKKSLAMQTSPTEEMIIPPSNHVKQQAIESPRLGYFGVIDERIDITLIAKIAESHPDWQIIMVGPVVKIDVETLPKHNNIHWLGQKSYAELPDLIASWDLCMMPFAINEATKFISPTKTLEYMAAERVVVSTDIRDVTEPYGHIVPIAKNHQEFIYLCQTLLAESTDARLNRLKIMHEIVEKTSWNKTAQAIKQLMSTYVKQISNYHPIPALLKEAQPALPIESKLRFENLKSVKQNKAETAFKRS